MQERNDHRALNACLAGVERRAFRIARFATRNQDDALDIVQDTMIRLCEKYGDRSKTEWPPLFFKILERRILDWHRRNTTRKKLFAWGGSAPALGDHGNGEVADFESSIHAPSAEESVVAEYKLDKLNRVLEALPLRQQQVFLLRIWQGLDVRETAAAMRCSQGSVKTHLFRATARIRKALDEA